MKDSKFKKYLFLGFVLVALALFGLYACTSYKGSASRNVCNPCAKNVCNPCAKNVCNPCAKKAMNVCNPCAKRY